MELCYSPARYGLKIKLRIYLPLEGCPRPIFRADPEYGLRFCRRSIFLYDFPVQRPCVRPYIFLKIVWGHRWGHFLKNQNPIEVIEFQKLPKSKIENGGWNQFAHRITTTVSEFCLGVTNSRKLTDPTNCMECGPWYNIYGIWHGR